MSPRHAAGLPRDPGRGSNGRHPRSCKTGELIEPTTQSLAQKLRQVAWAVALGIPAILISHWFLKSWTPRYYADLDALSQVDPVLAARKMAEFVTLLLSVPVLISVVVTAGALIYCSRVLVAGRWPLPGARVRKRTEVIAGWMCVRIPASLLSAALVAMLLLVWTSYIQMGSLFWNKHLDQRVESSSKSPQTVPPKPVYVHRPPGTGVRS